MARLESYGFEVLSNGALLVYGVVRTFFLFKGTGKILAILFQNDLK